jgi:hypothetical protein
MIVSSAVVGANTSSKEETLASKETTMGPAQLGRDLIWDNVVGVYGALGGVIVSVVRPDGTGFAADDFQLTAQKTVNALFWQGGYFQCELAQGLMDYDWDWRIIFWEDYGDGNKPGNEIYNQTIPTASIARSFWYDWTNPDNGRQYWAANYSAEIPEITFDANTKYWITIQGIGAYPPQACWCRHNDSVGGILLHQAVFKGVLWGYTDWTDLSVLVTDALPHDLNYQLLSLEDTTPPVTTATLEGDMSGDVYITDVTVTLTATDTGSGVHYTKYKVDESSWMDYTAPFIVTGNGEHTVGFYSVDYAGNEEEEKSVTFTIEYPVAIEIAIKGGLGVSAAIKNLGTSDLTDVDWTISLDGKLIFVGKEKSGTIASLAVGESVTVKDFVIGFGKTNIVVTAGPAEATAAGTVLLILVIGVT